MAEKVVLAYSGGLDTTAAVKWLMEKYGLDVITMTVALGKLERSEEEIRSRALATGAIKAVVVDARQQFIDDYVFRALKANALYEGQYPLATALARPLIAGLMVKVAREEKATALAHGCTGKGNDQVRFDVSTTALAPDLKIIAPAREWKMTRDETMEYARQHKIPLPAKDVSKYSIDENLWGRAIECGILEDPWVEPPEDVFGWTKSAKEAPDKPAYAEITFERGIPVSLNGERMSGVALVTRLNELAGDHGVGRIDHIEDRVIGIKSREVYEAPAAAVLIKAHQALEGLTLSRIQLRFKERAAQEYADLIYNGLWFTGHRHDLDAYIDSTQRHVTGQVRLRLNKGNCQVVGRRSQYSMYRHDLATYDKGDVFDQSAAPGFIHIWGLPAKVEAQVQDRRE